MALAVAVKAPACVPAGRLTLANPLASVSAVPDEGTKLVVLSVVVKVTAMPDTAAPLLSATSAFTVPALSGETDVIAAPDASINDKVNDGDAAAAVATAALVLHLP